MGLNINFGTIINGVSPNLQSSLDRIENDPVGRSSVDILNQLSASAYATGYRKGFFPEKILGLPNPLAKLNGLLANVGEKFLNGSDFLRNVGATLTGARTLGNGSQVNLPSLQSRAATSASWGQKLSAMVGGGNNGGIVGGSGTVLNQMGNTGGAFTWNGLTKTQDEMLAQAGLDASTPEGKRMILQFKMQNYSEVMQLVSNVAKQLSDISKSIIRNIS